MNSKSSNSIIDSHCEYFLRQASPNDADNIWNLMNDCSQTMEQKENFICDDLEYVIDILTVNGFGVIACNIDGNIVGTLLVKYPKLTEENLGYDVFLNFENSLQDNKSAFLPDKISNNYVLNPELSIKTDILLTSEELERVVHMDSASVLPKHRGHGLERRMIAFAESLIDTERYRYSFATVAPTNYASLRSLKKNGYQIMVTKEKYGGVIRHVMMKKLK